MQLLKLLQVIVMAAFEICGLALIVLAVCFFGGATNGTRISRNWSSAGGRSRPGVSGQHRSNHEMNNPGASR